MQGKADLQISDMYHFSPVRLMSVDRMYLSQNPEIPRFLCPVLSDLLQGFLFLPHSGNNPVLVFPLFQGQPDSGPLLSDAVARDGSSVQSQAIPVPFFPRNKPIPVLLPTYPLPFSLPQYETPGAAVESVSCCPHSPQAQRYRSNTRSCRPVQAWKPHSLKFHPAFRHKGGHSQGSTLHMPPHFCGTCLPRNTAHPPEYG